MKDFDTTSDSTLYNIIIYTVPYLKYLRMVVLYSASRNDFGKVYFLEEAAMVACGAPKRSYFPS